ncbi:ankyrin repeat domain-containing protein 39-like [Sabethes cyaneus]|uniref:ankyrin repeat domain-containing protein 39-like n=1 Tax=Sabethes cyaneus TaxID=53552 RepID=UPI00237DBE8C|nr:ankyrin repeat domain-containing protein 39-like [Sabethes cyaneus]
MAKAVHHQCNCAKTATASQSLDELEFERGIWTAAIENDERKLRALIDKGHLNDKDNSGYTALHYVARNGHLLMCRILLENGLGVDETTHGGATALHRAAMMGHESIVKLLLAYKANHLLQDSDGKTALHRAAEKGHVGVCTLLVHHDPAIVTICDAKGRKPLDTIDKLSPNYSKLMALSGV